MTSHTSLRANLALRDRPKYEENEAKGGNEIVFRATRRLKREAVATNPSSLFQTHRTEQRSRLERCVGAAAGYDTSIQAQSYHTRATEKLGTFQNQIVVSSQVTSLRWAHRERRFRASPQADCQCRYLSRRQVV